MFFVVGKNAVLANIFLYFKDVQHVPTNRDNSIVPRDMLRPPKYPCFPAAMYAKSHCRKSILYDKQIIYFQILDITCKYV